METSLLSFPLWIFHFSEAIVISCPLKYFKGTSICVIYPISFLFRIEPLWVLVQNYPSYKYYFQQLMNCVCFSKNAPKIHHENPTSSTSQKYSFRVRLWHRVSCCCEVHFSALTTQPMDQTSKWGKWLSSSLNRLFCIPLIHVSWRDGFYLLIHLLSDNMQALSQKMSLIGERGDSYSLPLFQPGNFADHVVCGDCGEEDTVHKSKLQLQGTHSGETCCQHERLSCCVQPYW